MRPTANADNLYLGAGSVFFDRLTAAGLNTGFRELGNVEAFEINTTVEEIEKKDDTDGARATLKKVITGTDSVVSMTLNEYILKNLALALLGDEAAVVQSSAVVTDEDINAGDALELDRWYDLGGFNNEVSAVEQGVTTLTPVTDYEISDDGSMIKLLSTGTATAVATKWTGYRPGHSRVQLQGLAAPRIQGHLRFISATNQVSGKRVQADFFRVSVRPDGALAFIGEEFGNFVLQATVEKDPNRAPGDPQFIIEEIPAASLGTS